MGRIKQFDEAEVLDKAMYCFWKHGYENTSVRLLEKEMGINQFSIYASFQNKQELYRRALLNYTNLLDQLFLKDLNKASATIKEVQVFLEAFALSIKRGKVPNSCLMVNSAVQLDQFDTSLQQIIQGFFDSMKSKFSKALQNSVAANMLSNDLNVEEEAEYLVGIAQSISIYCKLNSPAAIKKFIANAISKIK